MFTSITDQLAIGDEMTQEQLNVVAQQGYRTVVDLCTSQEGNTITEAQAREAGLVLKHMPVSMQTLSSETVKQFIATVEHAEGPVYTRCASGRRAALMAFLMQATQHRWTQSQFFERVEAAGFDCRSAPQLAAFAEDYLEHSASNTEN